MLLIWWIVIIGLVVVIEPYVNGFIDGILEARQDARKKSDE